MHIIGGGIIGLCSAWYLRQAGFDVTVIDKTDMQDGCSFGNAGIIVPSHSIPLASPGVVAQGIRWMFNSRSPFFIKPRLNADLLKWLWRFYRACNIAHVEKATPVMRDFHMLSKSLYEEFDSRDGFAFDFEKRGSLMLYRTPSAQHEELAAAEKAHALGVRISQLTTDQIEALHPEMRCDVLGGIHYHDDAHLYPGKFVLQLQAALQKAGVCFMPMHKVIGFKTSGSKISRIVFEDSSTVPVKHVLLASGAWSSKLAKHLGIQLLMQDGRGYSITMKDFAIRPLLPAILSEARVAVTPMGPDLRIGGTLEVSNFSTKINKRRVTAIIDAMSRYYPDFSRQAAISSPVWYGYRPVSADGVPYIGRPKAYDNLIIATGHAMLGLSLGPATGLLVSEIAQEKKTSLPMEIFNPDRHG